MSPPLNMLLINRKAFEFVVYKEVLKWLTVMLAKPLNPY